MANAFRTICSCIFGFAVHAAANGGTPVLIEDIQFAPTGTGDSPLLGQVVTVSGVVTSSFQIEGLGQLHIQQPGATQWAGIQLSFAPELLDLNVGDAITVSGLVAELGGRTALSNVSDLVVDGTGSIVPVRLDPNVFSTYSVEQTEPYESMLVTLAADEPITVVEQNADGFSNFGEWRVGSDAGMPTSGCRILTGRVTSQVSSSLNVSWINDSVWATNSGRLNVPPVVVMEGQPFKSITGIMSYSFSNMKLLPRTNVDVDAPPLFLSGFESEEVPGRVGL